MLTTQLVDTLLSPVILCVRHMRHTHARMSDCRTRENPTPYITRENHTISRANVCMLTPILEYTVSICCIPVDSRLCALTANNADNSRVTLSEDLAWLFPRKCVRMIDLCEGG
ncbi:hypothetical protein EVAR_102856_1 [Eumeta japonica]|uniref:Uncharacterized protein n=1 Tax=Eumeta variegata TaxID=151549 RepID=A0A4C1UP34_EUMVA|nr:hypothetical protein EVAR_102856_1 [Eumeta japonica]